MEIARVHYPLPGGDALHGIMLSEGEDLVTVEGFADPLTDEELNALLWVLGINDGNVPLKLAVQCYFSDASHLTIT